MQTAVVSQFFLFLFFVSSCFAYDIQSYSDESALQPERSLNLVFCSLHYQDKDDFAKDIGILIQGLKKTRPFDEFDSLGFWYITLSPQEEGGIFKSTEGFPPLMVRKDFVSDIPNHIKSVYKLIIIDAEGSASCAELSSIDKFSLVILGKQRYKYKEELLKGFLHELGHSLGLRDECVACEKVEPGYPNCAPTKELAVQWWGEFVGKHPAAGYINGACGSKDYFRPTIASLMNDTRKAADYGPINEEYIRKELLRLSGH